jgi:hypothetical protein
MDPGEYALNRLGQREGVEALAQLLEGAGLSEIALACLEAWA